MHLYEDVGMSKNKEIRLYGLTSSILFSILKSRDDQLCDGRPVTQEQVHNAENEDFESVVFQLFCKERSPALPIDGLMYQASASHFTAFLKIKNFQCSERRLLGDY